jgi:hypothetical protein
MPTTANRMNGKSLSRTAFVLPDPSPPPSSSPKPLLDEVVNVPGIATLNDPLCIFLVKNGSKGDKLLFRYPVPAAGEDDGLNVRSTLRS